jgi:plastocyanin
MTWRSAICFSVFSIAFSTAGRATQVCGSVSLRDSRVDAVTKRHDYSGVVVWLTPIDGAPIAPPAKHAVMTQKNKTFSPHILAIQAGTTVDFPNFDPIFHNAFSSYNGQVFDIGLYPPGSSRSVRFVRPGAVRVFCNIHPAMSAVILVLNTPYFRTTQADGAFQLDVPPGSYDLGVFHERATEQMLDRLSQRILITSDPVRLAPIVVSESGYLLTPHRNKYGRDYGPPPDDNITYPGKGR